MKYSAVGLGTAAVDESALIVEGSVSAALIALLQTAVLRMIPYAVPGLALVFLDLIYGIRAARKRGEPVRPSTAIRRTLTKVFLYICWIILATTLAISFGKDWLEWGTLGLVYANEGLSIIGNYLETKGVQFSIVGVYRWFIRWITGKAGAEISDDELSDVIKHKKHRNKKGQFAKKEE